MAGIDPTFESNKTDIKETSEKRLNAKLASPGQRDLGKGIDIFITALIFILCLHLTTVFEVATQYSDLIVIFFPGVYFLFSDALPRGQSIGKKIIRTSVVSKKTGDYCTVRQSLLRNVLIPIIGIIDTIFILTKSRQRIGDYLAGTIVIANNK